MPERSDPKMNAVARLIQFFVFLGLRIWVKGLAAEDIILK